jgi:predicted O-methyltransferase YrrM
LEALRANVAALGLSEQVMIVRSTSEEAARNWKDPIDLLFIDGDHSYEGVKRDWDLFAPYVKPFGIVVFHDTGWEMGHYRAQARPDMGVPRFVDELRAAGYPVVTINRDYGVSLVQPTRGGCSLRQLDYDLSVAKH